MMISLQSVYSRNDNFVLLFVNIMEAGNTKILRGSDQNLFLNYVWYIFFHFIHNWFWNVLCIVCFIKNHFNCWFFSLNSLFNFSFNFDLFLSFKLCFFLSFSLSNCLCLSLSLSF